ncbi:MAG: hypothetical protein RSB70_03865 [Clostridium sp.]
MFGKIIDIGSMSVFINLEDGRIIDVALNTLPQDSKIGDRVSVDTSSHSAISNSKTMNFL